MIVRMGISYTYQKYGHGAKISEHMEEFIKIYLKPYYDNSSMLQQRYQIRDSKHLNKLLFDNMHAIKFIFAKSRHNKRFTLDCAR